MVKQHFKIEGLEDLDRALTELPKATARNVLLRTLKEQGQPIRDAGEAMAPLGPNNSRAKYAVSTKLSRRQKKQNKKESMVEVYIGPGPDPSLLQQEFGNANHGPQPHLRPAWDSNVRGVLNGIRQSLAEQIEKARARLARKAERDAAKMRL
jgi:hypothetical protein